MTLYINDNNYFIVCPNKNYYNTDHIYYNLAQTYVNLLIIDYITIIKKSKIIKVINSCFSCVILPLQMKNELEANTIEILDR